MAELQPSKGEDKPTQKDHQQDLISRLRQWITRSVRLAVSGECLLLCTNKEELNGSKGSGSVSLRFVSPTSAQAVTRLDPINFFLVTHYHLSECSKVYREAEIGTEGAFCWVLTFRLNSRTVGRSNCENIIWGGIHEDSSDALNLSSQMFKGFAEQNSDDLQSAFNKIRDSLVNSAVSRIKEYKLLIQTQHSTDIYRISKACVIKSFPDAKGRAVGDSGIHRPHLLGHGRTGRSLKAECEDDLGLSSSDGEDHVPQALRVYKYDFEGSDLENPLDRSHRPYRLLISQGDISLHSLQLYFLGRDVELNLAMSQPFIAGLCMLEAIAKDRLMVPRRTSCETCQKDSATKPVSMDQAATIWGQTQGGTMRSAWKRRKDWMQESCLSPLFIASLAINVCLHMASTFLALQTDGVINPAYQSKEKQLNCIISEFFLIARQYSMGVLKILQDLDFDGMENAEEEASTPSQDSPLLDDFPHVLFAVWRACAVERRSVLLA
eukprot:766745-Hanusia_phi.AAC.3